MTCPYSPATTTLAILAGGQGSRMGGPKGAVRIEGKPILAYLLDRFAWDGPTLLVTAPGREHPPAYRRFTSEAVDPVADLGPLRGILTALEHAHTGDLLITTVDMPGIRRVDLEWLINQSRGLPQAHALLVERPTDAGPMVEPFPSFWRPSARQFVDGELHAGRRSVHGVLNLNGFQKCSAPRGCLPWTWTNLNRPADIQLFLEASARKHPR